MAVEELALQVVVEGFRKFESQMGTMNKSIGGMTAKWGETGKAASGAAAILANPAAAAIAAIVAAATAGAVALGAAVVGMAKLGAEGFKLATEFQSQMSVLTIAASSAGLSFDQLHDAALQVGGDTTLVGVSATGAADAMTGLYKAGLTTTEIFGDLDSYMAGTAELSGALRASIDLAAASELDMVQASDLAAIALSTFGGELETEEERANFVNRALNNLVQAADASVADVSDLGDALKNIGPTAASFGFNIEDVNNALAVLSTRGIKGSEAGTALKSMMTNMMRPTKAVNDAMSTLGINLYDSEGKMFSLRDIIGQLSGSMEGLTDKQKNQYIQTLAGTYGMKAMNTLLTEGVVGWDAMALATENAAGIEEQAGAKAATFSGQMEALEGVIETLKIGIGEAFLPVATELVQWFAEMVETYGPQLQALYEELGVWLGENLPIAIEATYSFITTKLIPGLKNFWSFTQKKVIPVIKVLAKKWIELLKIDIKILAAIWENVLLPTLIIVHTFLVEKVIPVLTTTWKWIKENLPPAIQKLSDFFNNVLLPALSAIWEFISTYVIPVMETLADIAVRVLGAAIDKLAEIWNTVLYPALQIVWGFIQDSLLPLLKTLGEFISAVLNAAVRVLARLWKEDIYPALDKVWRVIEEHVLPAFRKIKSDLDKNVMPVLEKMANVILPAIQLGFDLIAQAIETVVGWLKIAIDWFDKLGGASVPDIPGSGDNGGGGGRQPYSIPGGGYGHNYTYGGATYNYNLTTQAITRPGALALEFQAMEAMATR